MFTALLAVKQSFNAYFRYREIQIDNVIFRIHSVLTAVILLSASIILTTTQLIGNPIECLMSSKDDRLQKVVNSFCWIMSTFTMPENLESKYNNQDQVSHTYDNILASFQYSRYTNPTIAPGVGPGQGPERHYTYYQWVCFVLFFQALLCYIPKALWNVLEGDLLPKLATGLHGYCPFEEREKKTDAIVNYLKKYRRNHTWYTFLYWGCEALCLVNLVLQMFFMNKFFGGDFFRIGATALSRSQESQFHRNDPMILIFPRITKCTFNKYGPSGTMEVLDNLCILPQNIINEKTYIFIWFWYIALAVLFSILLLYRFMLVFLPGYRPHVLAARSRLARSPELFAISQTLDLGDWWLLYMLAKNVNPLIYKELINSLAKNTEKKRLYPDYQYTTLNSMDPTDTKSPYNKTVEPIYQSATNYNDPYPTKTPLYPTLPLPSPPINPDFKNIDTVDGPNVKNHILDSLSAEDFVKPKKSVSFDGLDSGKGTLEKR